MTVEIKYESYTFPTIYLGTCSEECKVIDDYMIGSVACQTKCIYSKRHGLKSPKDGWEDVLCSRLKEARGKI
jgi:hypothetical protein